MRRVLLFCALAVPTLCIAEVKASRFQNRDAWTIETARLRVTILQSGGHVGEIVLKGPDAVNPLWVQSRPTIDAEQYDPAKHEKFYGGGPGARLMSGLLGHNVCFPFWGNPSESEARAGMTYHGETGVVRWKMARWKMVQGKMVQGKMVQGKMAPPKQAAGAEDTLTVTAELPESKTRFTRTLRVAGQVAYFEELADNLGGWDRPVGWCEHVTLGPPFLEKGVTLTDASLTRGRSNGDASGPEFRWPEGAAETRIDLRTVRNIERSGFVNNFLVDPAREYGFFAAVHPRLRLLFGYVFRRDQFPWLNIWEANNEEMLTRGMEFSNTPTHGTMKALVEAPRVFDTPAYEWLEAKGRLRKRFAAFSVRAPEDYKGVGDVRIGSGRLEIVERETGRVMTLEFDAGRL